MPVESPVWARQRGPDVGDQHRERVTRCSRDRDDGCRGDEERQLPKAVTLWKAPVVAVETLTPPRKSPLEARVLGLPHPQADRGAATPTD